jgi:methyl-accepting chemotaxis protein
MSFRLRLTVLASLAVAVAIVGTSFVVYYTDRHELMGQVDTDLKESQSLPPLNAVVGVSSVGANGRGLLRKGAFVAGKQLLPSRFRLVLPRSSAAVQVRVAGQKKGPNVPKTLFATETIKNVPTRVLKIQTRYLTVTVSHSLVEVDRNLAHLRWLLFLICIGGTGVAAILGALVSGRAVAPLRRLTETTERIIDTGDLSERIEHRGRDEISRLSARLDELLGTLEASLRTQRQLVADASP